MPNTTVSGEVKDRSLAPAGKARIEWAARDMPVLGLVRERFEREQPLKGIRIAACLHVTSETAVLAQTLQAGGAEFTLCASNPYSTQDDVAASLVDHYGIATFAIREEGSDGYYRHIRACLEQRPDVVLDDGAELIQTLHDHFPDLASSLWAATEETNSGMLRLKARQAKGPLAFPVFAINDAEIRHLFDHRYGTGQSTVDGLIRATNILLCGRVVVVCGYGWCGRGVAMRARGFGANVIVTEVNPIRALEAVMDGYRVLPMERAAAEGDVFITVTGDISVVAKRHFEVMKDGAIVCNSGHFNLEIDVQGLDALSVGKEQVRPFVTEYTLRNGRRIGLLGEGRLINLSAAEGHPASVMDMSFALQALAAEHIVARGRNGFSPDIHRIPGAIDQELARLKLASLGLTIDHQVRTDES